MSESLRLYEIPPSPNNIKARIGLGYKNLSYERFPLTLESYPGYRAEVIQVSRQPRTPVLVHGDRAIFDSGAILRYLEANFPDTPPLFSEDFEEMGVIEEWEWFARTRLAEPTGIVFKAAFDPAVHPDTGEHATALMHELSARIEERLATSEFLVGNRLTVADVTAVPLIHLAMLPEQAAVDPITGYFRQHLNLGPGRERTRDWVGRVLQLDRYYGELLYAPAAGS